MLEFPRMDAQLALGSRIPFRHAEGQGAIVFDPARLRQAGPELFDPATSSLGAELVHARGGRGAAWFVSAQGIPAVLRQYRRGGWMARLSQDAYVWPGEAQVRSFSEFALMQHLNALGLPVPAPLAACYQRRGLFYRAAILVERVAGASSFAAAVAANPDSAPWKEAGVAIGRCHLRGARHADLNANNLLLDRYARVYLIDWDKGRIEPRPGAWCERVLARLQRSLRKECPGVSAADLAQGMDRLRAAHDRELKA